VELLADQHQLKTHDLLSALDQLPSGLDEAYNAAVDRITARKNPEHVKIALKTLKWVTFAKVPLEPKVLLHALVVREDTVDIPDRDLPDFEKIVSLCVGLVVRDKDGDKLRLVHETTQQYFQKYFRDVRNEDGDAEIAMACLRYFSLPAFSRGLFQSSVDMKDHLAKYSLSRYASHYCFVHIREGGLEVELYPVIVKIFKNHRTLDLVYQIGMYTMDGYVLHPDLLSGCDLGIHLLHLASMHGLCILCREILRQSKLLQKLYYLCKLSNLSKLSMAKMHLKVPTILESKDWGESTPLHTGAWYGVVEVVGLLLEEGANVNARDKQKWTPLHIGARTGHIGVVRLLLEKGANINMQASTECGRTALHLAIWEGHVEMVRLLLDKGANASVAQRSDGSTPLHLATYFGYIDAVRVLLEKGANVDQTNDQGLTPLHAAANSEDIDVVTLLLEKRPKVNARDSGRSTPLHYAASRGSVDVVRLLLDNGADAEAENCSGLTPLDKVAREMKLFAVNSKRLEVLQKVERMLEVDVRP
jgi:ankyrin repeat protein